MKQFSKRPQHYIKASVALSEQDVSNIVQQTQPDDTEYIIYSFNFDGEELELHADATDDIYESDDIDALEDDAIEAIDAWVTSIANRISSDPAWASMAESMLYRRTYDWYSGMTFQPGGPFTYDGFTFNAFNE